MYVATSQPSSGASNDSLLLLMLPSYRSQFEPTRGVATALRVCPSKCSTSSPKPGYSGLLVRPANHTSRGDRTDTEPSRPTAAGGSGSGYGTETWVQLPVQASWSEPPTGGAGEAGEAEAA